MGLSSLYLPNMALWSSAEGGFIGFEDETLSFLDAEGADNLMITSDDGFLEKPMLQTESGDRSSLTDVSQYTVKDGDSISSIAQEFGIDAQTIVEVNNISNPSRLRAGTVLQILPVSGFLHTMEGNATVDAVAKKYKVDASLIARQNGLSEDAVIAQGTKVIVPGARMIKVAPPVVASATRVASGGGSAPAANVYATAPSDGGLANTTGKTMIWPSKSPLVTQGYKYGHPALDIAYTSGDHTTGIHAAMAGKVIQSQGGWNGGYGNMIVLDHGNGIRTRYAHMSALYVQVGQYVGQGELIGWMGKTGRVYGRTGLHLHFEVIVNGRRVNPYQYL